MPLWWTSISRPIHILVNSYMADIDSSKSLSFPFLSGRATLRSLLPLIWRHYIHQHRQTISKPHEYLSLFLLVNLHHCCGVCQLDAKVDYLRSWVTVLPSVDEYIYGAEAASLAGKMLWLAMRTRVESGTAAKWPWIAGSIDVERRGWRWIGSIKTAV